MSFGVILAAVAAAVAPSVAITPYPAAFFAAKQPDTALDMVNLLPGFSFDAGDQVRGFGGAAGNVLIDGARPASKDDSLEEILKRIPATAVIRIDVIRGGAPGVDMQGKTVLANIVQRQSKGARLVMSASETTVQDGRVGWAVRMEASKTAGPTTWEGSLLANHGFDDEVANGGRIQVTPAGVLLENAQELASGSGYNYKATAAMETPMLDGRLRLNASLYVNPYHYSQADWIAASASQDLEDDHNRQSTGELGLRYDHALGGQANLESFLLQQFGEGRFRAAYDAPGDVESFKLSKETSESIARTTVNFQVNPALSLETGAEGDFNWLLDHTNYVVNDQPTSVPAANVRVTEFRGEAFGTTTWRFTRTMTLEAGLRMEASRIASTGDVVIGRTFLFPKPRVVLTWSPDDADQIRLRGEREVGQLDFDNFAAGAVPLSDGDVHAGNPSLTPQQDWVLEAAYDRRFWGGALATLTLRHFELTDVIDRVPIYDPSGPYDAPGNIGSGTKDEASLTLTLPTDRLGLKNGSLTAETTARRSRVTDPTTGQPRSISGLHPLDAQAHFTQGLPRWKLKWGIDVVNQWRETYYRYDEIDIEKLKTYVTLFGEYNPRGDLTIRLEIQNIGGRAGRFVREVYDGPRNTYPLYYTDIRDLHGGRSVYLRLRKTFN